MPDLEKSASQPPVPEGLVPSLGPFITTFFVVGAVIGSGIFRKSGVMAGQLGSAQLLMGVWVLAGLITLLGALINAEIAGMIPETGGQYVYFDRMYGPFAAHLYGWAVFAVIQTGSIASLAMVFAEHAAHFIALPELSPATAAISLHLPFIGDIRPFAEFGVKGLAALLIIGLTAVNFLGVKLGGVVQAIFAVAKISGMAALVLLVFLLPDIGHAANFTSRSSTLHLEGLAWWAAIAAALQGAFWAYYRG